MVSSLYKMDGDKFNPLIKSLFELMDNQTPNWYSVFHEDAVLDWFGRCIIGIPQIKLFLQTRFELTKHTIDSIKTCTPIQHRCLKQKCRKRPKNHVSGLEEYNEALRKIECGQGDGCLITKTPPNSSIPIDVSILNAPTRKKTLKYSYFDEKEHFSFRKVMGTLKLHKRDSNMGKFVAEKRLNYITIAFYKNKVKLIVYEGPKSCKHTVGRTLFED
uniref:Uncharacterized protein n=2 Tax=Clastoptera arizonana TaxID=38151 RepID=A0A1B6CL29_9HEMI